MVKIATSFARTVFHGRRGELRQRYREGQEDQLSALGVVVNIIMLWNTPLHRCAALEQLRHEGFRINPEDEARLSPLVFDHINLLGRYAFSVPESVGRGELRPLRNPGDPLEEASATLPVYVSRLSEFSVPLLPITQIAPRLGFD